MWFEEIISFENCDTVYTLLQKVNIYIRAKRQIMPV